MWMRIRAVKMERFTWSFTEGRRNMEETVPRFGSHFEKEE
jgi:hypothetical protein